MHGKIYKTELDQKKTMNIYASFGGLLMKISGNEEQLKKFQNDVRVFFLIMKT